MLVCFSWFNPWIALEAKPHVCEAEQWWHSFDYPLKNKLVPSDTWAFSVRRRGLSSSLLLTPSQLVSLINVSCVNGFLLPQKRTPVTQTPFPWFTLWIGLFVTLRKHYRVICWGIYIYLGKHSCLQSLSSSRFDGDHLLKSFNLDFRLTTSAAIPNHWTPIFLSFLLSPDNFHTVSTMKMKGGSNICVPCHWVWIHNQRECFIFINFNSLYEFVWIHSLHFKKKY